MASRARQHPSPFGAPWAATLIVALGLAGAAACGTSHAGLAGDGGAGSLSPSVSPDAAAIDVAHLKIDLSQTSASGLSSGGFMAVQFHVAFSSMMRGAAVFAGGPYDCAQGSLETALTACTLPPSAPPIAPLVQTTRTWASEALIDDPSNLASQRVFLFGGADDETVSPVVMDALASYYGAFLPSTSIQYVSRRPGTGHTMPTLDSGGPCDQSVAPWIGQCGYDGAGAALAQIYGTLSPRAASATGALTTLAQAMFATDPASLGLGDTAYVYVPAACAAGATCKVHVAFHGCEQEASGAVGTQFVEHAGYNEWADTNAIVVLYPQTLASAASPENPEACWDWWGYDGADYAQKKGAQIAMVRAMLDYLARASAVGDAGAGQGG